GGAYMQASYSGFKTNIFITKLNTAFQPVWSTYYAGIGNDVCMLDTTIFSDQGGGNNVTVDGCGNVYLGFFAYADPAIPVQQPCSGGYFNANSSGCNSCYDDFLVKFNNTGVRLW